MSVNLDIQLLFCQFNMLYVDSVAPDQPAHMCSLIWELNYNISVSFQIGQLWNTKRLRGSHKIPSTAANVSLFWKKRIKGEDCWSLEKRQQHHSCDFNRICMYNDQISSIHQSNCAYCRKKGFMYTSNPERHFRLSSHCCILSGQKNISLLDSAIL